MPLPTLLQALARTRRFWTDFFGQTEAQGDAYSSLKDCTVNLAVAGGYELTLGLDSALCYFSLGFLVPGREAMEIAWDDQAHWHPHVLRWQELELICRCLAMQDPQLTHPGVALLLLHRFAPICHGDDLDLIVPMLEAAWRQLSVFSNSEIRAFIERADARDFGFQWSYEEAIQGWCLQERDPQRGGLYTLRTTQNTEFPFGAWEQMLKRAREILGRLKGAADESARDFAQTGDMTIVPRIARSLHTSNNVGLADVLANRPSLAQVCWVVEVLLGMEMGSLLKQYVRPQLALREQNILYLTLPLRDSKRPVPQAAGPFIAASLNRVLSDCNLGGRAGSGSGPTSMMESFQIKGHVNRGVELLREVLWWTSAPESVRLSRNFQEQIPLALADDAGARGDFYVQVCEIRTAHWRRGAKKCYRFDRVPFSQACRHTLRSVLAGAGAQSPNEDGWHVLNLSDGGFVELCFRRLDEDPMLDGGTIAIHKWSNEAAGFLHRLLQEAKLMLLPMSIATSNEVAQTIEAPWPRVRVVQTAAELYEILRRGPRTWWADQ
jgi:hypothetical protein